MRRLFSLLFALGLSLAPLQAQPHDYVGLWWISHGTGEPLQLRVYPDGSCWSDFPSNNPGRWELKDNKLRCFWADDWKEILYFDSHRAHKLGFRPKSPIDGPADNHSRAFQVSSRPDGWFGSKP